MYLRLPESVADSPFVGHRLACPNYYTIKLCMPHAVDDVGGASTTLLPQEEGGAEEVGHPSPAAAPGRGCEPADAGSEAGVGHPSSVIGPTSRAEVGGEEVTRVVGGPDSQQHQAGDTEGRHEGRKDLSGSTPSPKVERSCGEHSRLRFLYWAGVIR